jgi:shikimate kinase
MTALLLTGMSGTGKSSVLDELSARGFTTVDTDTEEWSEWVEDADGSPDWVWREDRISMLLAAPSDGPVFVAGCKSNQGKFYDRFAEVVLLSAPADVLLARIAARSSNDYGKEPEQWSEIVLYLATVEPLLRSSCTAEIDATRPLIEVTDEVVRLATAAR